MKSFVITCHNAESIQFELRLPLLCSPDQIHIWIALTHECSNYINSFKSVLNQAELVKSAKFRFAKDGHLYIISHGLLRIILARYLQTNPAQLNFTTNVKGKPYLTAENNYLFNLSHTAEIIAIAISRQSEVGVDLEKLQPNFEWQEIAQYYFNEKELQLLNATGKPEVTHLFFQYWTKKEAFLKAIGVGLIDNIGKIKVADPTNFVQLENREILVPVKDEWKITSFPIQNKYVLSLAASPEIQKIQFFNANLLSKEF